MATKNGGGRSGRRKIPIQMIENIDARHVCFSKRRRGLFKKAAEISALCGAPTAVVAFSVGGRPFSFAYPSVDAVVDRFLDLHRASPAPVDVAGSDGSDTRLAALLDQLQPIDGLGIEELERMQMMLEASRRALSARADELASARRGGGI